MLPSCHSRPNEYSLGTDNVVKYTPPPKKYSHHFAVYNHLTIVSLDAMKHIKLVGWSVCKADNLTAICEPIV
jgi:hypothetical protein